MNLPRFERSLMTLVSLAVTAAAAAGPANAQNILINPGFETGTFAGWTQSGNTGFTFVDATDPHTGTYSAKVGPSGSDGFLTQTFATVPGDLYEVSFWFASDGQVPNDFGLTANFTGAPTVLFSGTNFPSTRGTAQQPQYFQYVFNATATQPLSAIVFNFRDDIGFLYFDDVSVIDRTLNPSPIPEPGAIATGVSMFGMTALGLVRGRRRWAATGAAASRLV